MPHRFNFPLIQSMLFIGSGEGILHKLHAILLRLCISTMLAGSCGIASAQSWAQVPNSGYVIAAAVRADGTIIGVGAENQLWTRSTLNSEWKHVPNSGSVNSVAVMKDGTIIGVGWDNQLWTRATLTSEWKQVPNSGHAIGVAVMPDGSILGVGGDKQLWTRATLTSEWKLVPNSGSVTGVTVMADGTIIGVGWDSLLWTRATLTSEWKQVPNSGYVTSVAVLPNGLILGVGKDRQLWTRSKESLALANVGGGAPAGGSPSAPTTSEGHSAPWVAGSFAGPYLPLAGVAEIWSNPKPFKRPGGQTTVQSRFLFQKGTTCRFEVQFNNVGSNAVDETVMVGRPGKVAWSQYDHPIRIKLNPGASYAFGTEVRECPLNWGETKEMGKCAACEPVVYFSAQ